MKPTQRHTKSRKRIRRGAIKLKKVTLTKCPKCKKPIQPHTACKFCGKYKGNEVIKIKMSKIEKKALAKVEKEKKLKKKEEKKDKK
jgi:large subunit ribosomal protein L32